MKGSKSCSENDKRLVLYIKEVKTILHEKNMKRRKNYNENSKTFIALDKNQNGSL